MNESLITRIIKSLSLQARGILLVTTPLVIQFVLIAVLYGLLLNLQSQARSEERVKEVLGQAYVVCVSVPEYAILLGFQRTGLGLVSDAQMEKKLSIVAHRMNKLCEIASQNPAQADNIARFKEGQKWLLHLAYAAPPVYDIDRDQQLQWKVVKQVEKMFDCTKQIISLEDQKLAEAPHIKAEYRFYLHICIYLSVAASLLLGVLLAAYYAKSIRDPLLCVANNARQLSQRQPLSPALSGNDEIAQLDRQLHQIDIAVGEALKRQTDLIDNASAMVCSIDHEYNISKVNSTAFRLTGRHVEELVNTSVLGIVDEQSHELLKKQFALARTGSLPISFNLDVEQKSKSSLPALWSVYYSESEDQLFCVIHDMSMRKRMENMKQEFSSLLRKDLQLPLDAAIDSLTTLQDEDGSGLSERSEESLANVRRNLQRLEHMLDDLLEMEQKEDCSIKMERRTCCLQELLYSAANMLGSMAQARNITIRLEAPPTELNIDETKILRVVLNLLSNAIKFSPSGGIIDVISLRSDKQIEIQVIDEGSGIPPEKVELIFEAFRQLDGKDEGKNSGSGLGLAICKSFIEEHGGAMGVRAGKERGSCFWFTLPLQRDNSQASSSPEHI